MEKENKSVKLKAKKLSAKTKKNQKIQINK